MSNLHIKPKRDCMWDLVSLGEVMLRLDPGDGRIATTREFRAPGRAAASTTSRAGCGAASACSTAVVTALADNPVGRLVEDLMLQGGVDSARALGASTTASAATVRNGLNFTERGFGVRAASAARIAATRRSRS